MIVGILQVELLIHDAMSLKQKRSVVRSIKDRLGQEFNLAIAETDQQDMHNVAVLGMVTVSNSSRHAQSSLDKVVEKLRQNTRISIIDRQVELISGTS